MGKTSVTAWIFQNCCAISSAWPDVELRFCPWLFLFKYWTVAKFIVPDSGIGYRTGPPGYLGWQAGTTTLCRIQLYPSFSDCEFGYLSDQRSSLCLLVCISSYGQCTSRGFLLSADQCHSAVCVVINRRDREWVDLRLRSGERTWGFFLHQNITRTNKEAASRLIGRYKPE